MEKLTRRDFLKIVSAATLAGAAAPSPAAHLFGPAGRQRVFVGSNTPDGILAFDWDAANGELAPAGVAAKLDNVDWITYSPDRKYLFAAGEMDSLKGKPTGAVASFSVVDGGLRPLSQQNSAGKGTCHVALDHTGRVLLSADYGGGSAAAFLVTDGKLSPLAWSEHYTGHGPNAGRQQTAHAHFASFSPDNRFAYINDLGGDCIHIYRLFAGDGMFSLLPAGSYHARPGDGPRTLHFHPNGHTAYCMNELNSTVDVLEWSKNDGSLAPQAKIELLPKVHGEGNTGCDTVISGDGRFVYFANRGTDFILTCKADPASGNLTPIGPASCGGKTPRNFVLDPTERWMLAANQGSSLISVFARDPESGALAKEGKSFAAATPMCILFA